MKINVLVLLRSIILSFSTAISVGAFQLKTSSTIRGINKVDLHDFLATPTNWPDIVASSASVKCLSFSANRIDAPLKVGDYVEEVFGLPPLLPLSVVWQCTKADPSKGNLEFSSEDDVGLGVPLLVKRCKMIFSISECVDSKDVSCNVDFTMEFDPVNPIVFAGVPLLNIDNELALKVLLPTAIKKRQHSLSM